MLTLCNLIRLLPPTLTSAGGGVKPGFEGGQTPQRLRIPKRGFHNPFKRTYNPLNLTTLRQRIEEGRLDATRVITMRELWASSAVGHQLQDGVKLLARGARAWDIPVHIEASWSGWAEASEVDAEWKSCMGHPLIRVRWSDGMDARDTEPPLQGSADALTPCHATVPGEPSFGHRTAGDRGGWRERDHGVLQCAGPEGPHPARLVCEEGALVATPGPAAPAAGNQVRAHGSAATAARPDGRGAAGCDGLSVLDPQAVCWRVGMLKSVSDAREPFLVVKGSAGHAVPYRRGK